MRETALGQRPMPTDDEFAIMESGKFITGHDDKRNQRVLHYKDIEGFKK